MKPKSVFTRTSALIAIGMSASLLMGHAGMASHPIATVSRKNPGEDEPKKSKATTTTANAATTAGSSRNNESVKIYPDAIKRLMHVIAKENNGKQIDFFVFDLNGTIIQNFKMKEKDHIKITGLARGKYVYRVFVGDEETASGNFEIR